MPKGIFLYDARGLLTGMGERRTGKFRVFMVEGCRAYHCGIIYEGEKGWLLYWRRKGKGLWGGISRKRAVK